MSHDGQSGDGVSCNSNDGLMGYGDGNEFSACSIRSFNEYFAQSDGLTCLSDGVGAFSSNYDDGEGNVAPTPPPAPNPTPRPSASSNGSDNGNEWNCVGINGMIGSDTYNGNWAQYQRNDGKPAYTLNSYYLYYHSTYSYWLISGALGSDGVKAYCPSSDLSSCSGQFKSYTSRGWLTESTMKVFSCVDEGGDNELPCTNYECLTIAAMTTDKYGRSYNGEWSPSGCINGQSYYTKDDDLSRILCYSADYNLWILTNTVQCGGAGAEFFGYSPQQSTEITATAGNWQIMGMQGWIYDEDVLLTDCGKGAGLTQCFDEEYGDNLCLSSDDMLWSGNQTFELYTKLCSNNQPIYFYKVYSEVVEDSFGESEQIVDSVYFLHFVKELKYSDGNETISKWIISKDEVSVNSIAECANDNLLKCTEWIVESEMRVESAADGFIDEFIPWVYSEKMRVNSGECPTNAEPKGASVELIVVLCGAVAIICVCCSCFVWHNCNQSESKSIQKVISQSRLQLSPKYIMRQISSPRNHVELKDVDDEEFINIELEVDECQQTKDLAA